MNARISLCGSYPRKEELVKATWNFDKGLVDANELRKLQEASAREVIEIQKRSGFAPIVDGLLTWQDQFRPLVETSPSFEVGGVTRLFETNRFFRQPILHKEPKLDWAKLESSFPHTNFTGESWKAILPSPYWFTRVTQDHVYHDEQKLGYALAAYVNQVAKRLEKAGYAEIQFQEGMLFHEAEPDVGFANELLARAIEGLKTPTLANFINGDAAPHHAFLQTVPTSAIGIDFVETLPEKLPPKLQGKNIVAQVVNAQESLLESTKEVQDLLKRVESKLKPSKLTATHTWDLEFIPHEVAQKKLDVLGSILTKKVTA
jgi:methionine synthase II (cobalamin-independent)